MNRFVTFSGLDGSGKSEQIKMLSRALHELGVKHTIVYSRIGRSTEISAVRYFLGWLLQQIDRKSYKYRTDWFKTAVISIFIRLSILDILLRYTILYRIKSIGRDIILCDRYIFDSYIDLVALHDMCEPDNILAWRLVERFSPPPSLSILLSISASEANKREQAREGMYVEQIKASLHREELYKELAQKGKWDIVIDGNASRHTIHQKVIREVLMLITE